MNLIEGSVRQPHTAIVLVLLCCLFGYISLQNIPVQLKPSLDKPEIEIATNYRGASPYEVEEQITRRIEDEMDGVEGVRRVTSVSRDGNSQITLEFDWGVDKNVSMIDVINKLNQVPDFPDEADEPVVTSVSSDESEPIMWIVSQTDSLVPNELFEIIEDVVEPQLRRSTGVGDLWVFGGEESEMQVRIDPTLMVSRGVSVSDLVASLQRENLNVRGGFFEEGKRQFNVRTVGQFTNPENIEKIIVARNDMGTIYLGEIADVMPGYKKTLSQVGTNGQPTAVMGVIRKSGSNVVEVCNELVERIDALNADFREKGQDIQLKIAYKDETYITQAMDVAWSNLAMGALLACIVLLLFLRSVRSLLVVAITIPTCMITVFIFLNAFGRSLNIISLAGLAFSGGMIVDNAIVVVENIYRHLSMGKKAMEAAVKGTKEVWGAIVISTLTTLAVFLPIIFIEEEAGQLFKDIAIAICLAISLSLLAAVTLIPMLSSRLSRPPKSEEEWANSKFRFLHTLGKWVGFMWLGVLVRKAYHYIIYHTIKRSPGAIIAKVLIITAVVGVFFTSLKLLPDAEYLPSGNRNLVLVFAKPLVGSNIDKTVEQIKPFEQMLLADKRVERFFTVFGGRFNAVGIIVKPEYASEPEMKAFVGEMFGKTRGLAGFESLFPVQASIFRDPGKQLEIDIIGPSLDRLQQVSSSIEGQLYQTKGVQFVRSGFSAGNPEVQVVIDRQRSASLGLRVADIASLVEAMVAGKVVGNFNDDGKQIDLTLYAKDGLVDSRIDLASVKFLTPSGESVRLDTVADIITTTGPTAINHVEKERSITLTVNLTEEVALEEAITAINTNILSPMRATLPSTYFLKLGGTADKLTTTLNALTGSFGLAVLIIYLLMVALFRSWVYPFIIMVTIPMAMSGAFLGITVAHTMSDGLIIFDVLSMLGLIILAGIVVNNAILIIHQTLNFEEEGMHPSDALRHACDSRLRPIAMSVTTTVLAMIPLAMGQGAGTELYRGLGAVIIGGLAVSTVFTLFLVPALFSLVLDLQALTRKLLGKERIDIDPDELPDA